MSVVDYINLARFHIVDYVMSETEEIVFRLSGRSATEEMKRRGATCRRYDSLLLIYYFDKDDNIVGCVYAENTTWETLTFEPFPIGVRTESIKVWRDNFTICEKL